MPNYAFLSSDLKCPSCATVLTDLIWFQWGYCPGSLPRREYVYSIGDKIYWKACKDGTVSPWTMFDNITANVGEPLISNLIVRDDTQYFPQNSCRACGQVIGGIALQIVEGVIDRAWIYPPGELDNEIVIFIVEQNGNLKPMPEWNDYTGLKHLPYDC